MSADACRGQERALDLLELVMSDLTQAGNAEPL